MSIIFFIGVFGLLVCSAFVLLMKKTTTNVQDSISIINSFEPDNTAPKLTDMIDYHKNNKGSKYIL